MSSLGRRLPFVAPALVVAVAAIACGGGSGGEAYEQPTGPAVARVRFEARNFAFEPKNTTISPAGTEQITMKNVEGAHTLVIEGVPGFKLSGASGESDTGKVELKARDYTIYCDISGHREAGMEGTLTVG